MNTQFFASQDAPLRDAPSILCDAVQSLAIHNGVIRILFSRLRAEGDAVASLELLIPDGTLDSVLAALQTLDV